MSGPSLHDGLWLVQCTKSTTSYKNLYVRLADLPDCHDLEILGKAVLLEETILSVLRTALDGHCTLQDIASKIAASLVTQETKLTLKHFRG